MLLSPHHGQSVHVSLVCRNDFSLGHFGRLIEGLWTQVTGALRSKRRDARRATRVRRRARSPRVSISNTTHCDTVLQRSSN